MVLVIVNMAVEGSTEAVDEAHRSKAGLRAGAAALAQMGQAAPAAYLPSAWSA
jgi:hypothetical protein